MPNYLSTLNSEQRSAVETTEGYVRVIAGAGSGKTRALTCRFIYLVDQMGVSPANILCVTFTNKAAREMKNRIHSFLGDMDFGMICTFHGFCVKVLKEDGRKMGYPRNFIVLDTEDQEAILKKVYDNSGYKATDVSFRNALEAISSYKKNLEYLELFEPGRENVIFEHYQEENDLVKKIIFGYLYEQRKNYALDFNDLINAALYIFKKHSDVLEKWQKRLEYIMVDEFQDVNRTEFELCRLLSLFHKNLFVVGDPDQTIYSFRGADVSIILDYDKIFPNARTIMMNTNYRSSKNIIDVSNSLISKNNFRMAKQLNPTRGNETLVVYNHACSAKEEMEWIAKQIQLLLDNGVPESKIAVLYRAHYVTREIEESFMRHKIQYTIYSGIPFYGRKEIKDVLSYLRMIITGDDFSFLRTINEPKRNFGKKRVEILAEFQSQNSCTLYEALKENLDNPLIKKTDAINYVSLIEGLKTKYTNQSLSDLLKAILRESGYEDMLRQSGDDDRLENLAELEQSILDYENNAGEEVSLADYLSMVALYTNVDKEEKKDKVSLMTVHSAKGLEFPYVFVCALSEGIFPSSRTRTQRDLEEERRLAYVAFTRAINALFLSDSDGYNLNHTQKYPSRFIFNIDKQLLDYTVELDQTLIESAQSYINQTESWRNVQAETDPGFTEGQKVFHRAWGPGIIVSIDKQNTSMEIRWDRFETTRHISFEAAKRLITTESVTGENEFENKKQIKQAADECSTSEVKTDEDSPANKELYERAVQICAEKNPSFANPLHSMQYVSTNGSDVLVSFPRNKMLHMRIIVRKTQTLEEAFSEVYGHPVHLIISLGS